MRLTTVLLTMSAVALVSIGLKSISTPARMQEKSRNIITDPTYLRKQQQRHELMSQAYHAWKREHSLGKAERLFRQLISSDEGNPSYWLDLAQVLDEQHRAQEAMEAYKNVVHPAPGWGYSASNMPAITMRYAQLCEQYGKRDEALQMYSRILNTNAYDEKQQQILRRALRETSATPPTIGADAQNDADVRARALVVAGQTHRWQGEFPEAIQCYQDAIRVDPNLAVAHFYLAQTHDYLSHERGAAQHKQEAQTEYQKAGRFGDSAMQAALHGKATRLRALMEEHERTYHTGITRQLVVDDAGNIHRLPQSVAVTPHGRPNSSH